MIPSPLYEPGYKTFSYNQKHFTCFITCLVFDTLLGPFYICSTYVLVRYCIGGIFYFLFPMSHIFIKLIMVRPFGNYHVLIKGFSLSWCKTTVNFCLFNCWVVLYHMIYACVISNGRVFGILQLHHCNNCLFLTLGRS